MKKTLFLFFILCLFSAIIAVPASPYPLTKALPDGSELTIRLMGDEYVHWAQTVDGYTLIEENGFYFYGVKNGEDLINSGIRAHDFKDATEQEFCRTHKTDLRYSRRQVAEKLEAFPKRNYNQRVGGFPTTGTRNLLMILANFSDTSTLHGQSSFNNYMNQTNYNGTGSFKDYYLENSHNQLTVNTTVTAWVNVTGTHDSYGPEAQWDDFAYHAIQAADAAGVDFSTFDNDGDGVVEGIAIIHQGPGQESTSDTSDIWSHSYSLAYSYSSAARTFDGVQVGEYTVQPELAGTGTSMATIGVMCHEFGHNLGAPDFYDTDYSTGGQQSGTGYWDLMGSGAWNNNGATPAHHNAYSKWKYYNWISPTLLTAAFSPSLNSSVSSTTDYYYYTTTTANEFFLLENRQQTGFDSYIPGHGLIVYHVDENYIATHLNSNDINASSHQGMYLKAAGGSVNASTCPFPGTGFKTSFTDTSSPNSHSWLGANTNKPITNISESAGVISLDFMGGSYVTTAITSPNDGSNHFVGDTITVNATSTTTVGLVAYTTIVVADAMGTPIWNDQDNTQPWSFDWNTTLGLSPGRYTLNVTGYGTTGHTHSDIISVYVNDEGVILSEGFEVGTIPGGWNELIISGTVGWQFLAGNGGSNPPMSSEGSLNAVLRDTDSADDKTRLVTPLLSFGQYTNNKEISFDLCQQFWPNDQDEFELYMSVDGGAWALLLGVYTDIPNWTTQSIPINTSGTTYQFAFEGNAKYGYGVCIDNIQITGEDPNPKPAINPLPVDMASDVDPSMTLTWNPDPTGTAPTGYSVYLDTSVNPTTLVSVANSTSLDTALNHGSTYFWKVVPNTSSKGDAPNCPIWSFTTANVQPTDNTGAGDVAPTNEADIPEGTVIVIDDPTEEPSVPSGTVLLEDVVVSVTSSSPVTLRVTIDFIGNGTHVYHVEGDTNLADGILNWGAGTVWFDYTFSGAAKGDDTFVVIDEGDPLAVTLSTFNAAVISAEDVEIHWVTESETSTNHYNILRSAEESVNLADNLTINSPILAQHNGSSNEYYYTDSEFISGETYFYWLEAVEYDGQISLFGPIEVICEYEEEPGDTPDLGITALNSVYPNPFNPNLTISFSLKEEQNITIDVYNSRGQFVANVVSERLGDGDYNRTWNGIDSNGNTAQSGIYFIKLKTVDKVFTSKAVLLK